MANDILIGLAEQGMKKIKIICYFKENLVNMKKSDMKCKGCTCLTQFYFNAVYISHESWEIVAM